MKKAIFIFLCFGSICNGQNKQIDSLVNVLKAAKEDTSKVNTLNALSEKLWRAGANEKARGHANDALQLADKLNYKKGQANAYFNIGSLYYIQGNYQEAMKSYSMRLKISEEIGDKQGIANGYFGVGNAYNAIGNYSEALKYYFSSLKIREEMGDKRGISNVYNNIGIIYDRQKNYAEALKIYYAAIKIKEEIGDKADIGSCYHNIGVIYSQQGNDSEALKNYLISLHIDEEIGDKKSIADNYNNIATVYFARGNYPEALKGYFNAVKLEEEIGSKLGIATAYNNIGFLYVRVRRYAEARKYLNDAILLGKEMGSKDDIKEFYKSVIGLDTATGNYKQAMADQRMYDVYKDSLLNETTQKQITEMKAKYESEKNEKEITLLTKDNEIQNIEIKKQKQLKYSFIVGLTLVILLLLFGYRVYRSRQILRLQDIRNKIASDLHDDIGSTLNSISVYSEVARKNDAQHDEALEMIGDSSRKIIDAMSDIVWTINPENDSFAKIIFRMKSLAYNLLRAKNIEYTFHSNEHLDEKKLSLEDRRNFFLIFKEAINNIVKYSNASRVAINLSNENDHLKLSIKDNGIGFDMTQENAGNGLKSMKRRADEMKAKFKMESQLESGTQIELTLAA